jgi:hypothetical protein
MLIQRYPKGGLFRPRVLTLGETRIRYLQSVSLTSTRNSYFLLWMDDCSVLGLDRRMGDYLEEL